ncbi:MAG: 1-phosphofructokinase family hexose kinase [Maritimibacter sp.]|nr:1-phosphofructokinase family hexose kinase [Maritimibacter sp.]
MTNILTITLNPAVDRSTSTDHVVPEEKLRCETPVTEAGGGGINVARAIGVMGGMARAFVAISGFQGQRYLERLRTEPLIPEVFHTHGETRQSFAVIDRSTGEQYRFVTPGPTWTPQQSVDVLTAIRRCTPQKGWVVLSGSQPPGVPLDFPSKLAAQMEDHSAHLILDTSGAPLKALLQAGAAQQDVLRLDGAESEDLAGRKFANMHQVGDFAQELIERGVARVVVLALGSEGSILVENGNRWHAKTRPVVPVSKVGAGDSFVGVFTWSLSQGASWEEALRMGVCAAASAVTTDGTELCRKDQVEDLATDALLERI